MADLSQPFAARLAELDARASPIPWHHDDDLDTVENAEGDIVDETVECQIRSGGTTYEGITVYDRSLDFWNLHDADLIVYLRNHTEAILGLVEAAERLRVAGFGMIPQTWPAHDEVVAALEALNRG